MSKQPRWKLWMRVPMDENSVDIHVSGKMGAKELERLIHALQTTHRWLVEDEATSGAGLYADTATAEDL